jgi:PAS domain S-box-containing protein
MNRKRADKHCLSSLLAQFRRRVKKTEISGQYTAIAEALNEAVKILTSHSEDTFNDVMSNGLRPIAEAIGLDRIVVYQILNEEGDLGQTYVWAHGKTSTFDAELTKLPSNPPVIRWLKILKKDDCINARVDKMAEDEASFLSLYKVKSIFFVPIFTHNKFWGVVTLEDQMNYRYFDEDCFGLMRSAAFLCTSAVLHAEMVREIVNANEFNRTLIDTAPFGLTVINDNLHAIDCNEAILKLLGSKKQYYLDHFFEFMPELQNDGKKSEEKAIENIKRTLNGEMQVTEWMHRSNSGELIPSEVTLVRTKLDGNFIVLGYQYDLRNIKKMEREVAETNEFNQVLLKVAPVGITIIDENLNVVDCNDTVLEQLKTTREIYKHNFLQFSTEYQNDGKKTEKKAESEIKRALKGENVVIEWMFRSSEGELIPSEITLVRAKLGNKYVVLVYQYDLRNIRKMEENILEAEQMVRAIKEASPLSYVLFDENLKAIDCNDAILQILGCPDKQYLLEHYWDSFLPESQPDGSNSLRKAIERRNEASASKNRRILFEWAHRSLNGELIPTENTLTEIIHRGKKYVISFKYDLRAVKKMMENIREQGELLSIQLEQQKLISYISKGFISSGDSDTYIKEAIGKLGHYHKVSQVFIFRIDYQHNNVTPMYCWAADGVFPRMAEFDLYSAIKSSFPEKLPDSSTVPVIACPDIVASKIENFSPMLDVDVRAYICAPLYVEGHLWGIMNVEQCAEPRQWTENEKQFMAIAANTITGLIMRKNR